MPGRKKYGYLLLLFLVLSGLAGTPTNNSLTRKERTFASDFLKATKADFLETIKGLTPKQLDYKKASSDITIRQYVYQVIYTDKNLRDALDKAMMSVANPEQRSQIIFSDEHLINMVNDQSKAASIIEMFKRETNPNKTFQQALNEFKTSRTHYIKYIKATSEDLRNHIIKTPIGWLDAYQVCLLISSQTYCLTQQIVKRMAEPGFPGQLLKN